MPPTCRGPSGAKTAAWNKLVQNLIKHVSGSKHIGHVTASMNNQRNGIARNSVSLQIGFTLVSLAYQGIQLGHSYR